ncbi:unnamed protein product [Rhizopus microsporus]
MNLNMYEANANENPDNRRKHSFSCRTWTHVRERAISSKAVSRSNGLYRSYTPDPGTGAACLVIEQRNVSIAKI